MNVLQLAKKLINFTSVTPDDGGVQAWINAMLNAKGYQYCDLSSQGITNGYWQIGSGKPHIVLAGHSDVVPAGCASLWQSDPFTANIRGDYLYGRGSADMKGAIAAMLAVLLDFKPPQGTLGLAITSDEEGQAEHGSRIIADWLQVQHQVDCVLIGEPSSENTLADTIKNGRRGSLHARITIKAPSKHVAYSDWQTNGLHQCLAMIDKLQAKIPAGTHMHVVRLQAGTAENMTPDHCFCQINWRHPKKVSKESIVAMVADHLPADAEVSWRSLPAYQSPDSGPFLQLLRQQIPGAALSQSGGSSDGRFFQQAAKEVFELGLCRKSIHQPNECVRVSDLNKLRWLYQNWLTAAFSQAQPTNNVQSASVVHAR